jgi:hypothetical protein
MTREQTKEILAVLKAGYPNFYKDMSKNEAKNIIDLWTTMFANDSAEIVTEAVKSLICSNKYPPTIADVKEKIYMITQPQTLTEIEAWQMVRGAINYFNASESFASLPQILQKLVGSPNQLREWAMLEAKDVDSVIQSNFMRSYKAKVAQEKDYAMLPASTKELIQSIATKMDMKAITGGLDES